MATLPPTDRGVPSEPRTAVVSGHAGHAAFVGGRQAVMVDEGEWRELVATLPQIVWITRPDGYHVYFNQQWMDFTGLTLAASLGDGWNPPFHPDDRPLASRLWADATRTGDPYEIEYRLRRHDGVYRWMLGRAVPLRDESGEIVKWFGTCTDIEELRTTLDVAAELRKELERRATHDSLTGLGNRSLLLDQLDLMLNQRRRGGIAVVFIDLDWFKDITTATVTGPAISCSCASPTAFEQQYARATWRLASAVTSSWWSARPRMPTMRSTSVSASSTQSAAVSASTADTSRLQPASASATSTVVSRRAPT